MGLFYFSKKITRRIYKIFFKNDIVESKKMKLLSIKNMVLVDELEDAEFLGRATRWDADIYSVDGATSPNLMTEICRARKLSYAGVGVRLDDGHGDAGDLDGTYKQLIVWDRARDAVVGGYRYAVGAQVEVERLSLSRYFNLSERFKREYLPRGVELGRSFISPDYQCGAQRLTIYALDALWEGVAKVVKQSGAEYLFGRVTLYEDLGVRARNILVGYMQHNAASDGALMVAKEPLRVGISRRKFGEIFNGSTPEENYKILLSTMRSMRRRIPPIISSYLRLSPSLRLFGSYRNRELGGVVESAIMLTISDFYDVVKSRYGL